MNEVDAGSTVTTMDIFVLSLLLFRFVVARSLARTDFTAVHIYTDTLMKHWPIAPEAAATRRRTKIPTSKSTQIHTILKSSHSHDDDKDRSID